MISLDGLLLGKEGFCIDLLIMSITDGDNSELLRFHPSASCVRSQAKSRAGTRWSARRRTCWNQAFNFLMHTLMHFVAQYCAFIHLLNPFSFFVNAKNIILYSLLLIISNYWHRFRKLQRTNKLDSLAFFDWIFLSPCTSSCR